MKDLVGAFNKEKALVGTYSGHCEISLTALISTLTWLDLGVYGLHLPAEAEPLQQVVEGGRGEQEAEVEAGPPPRPGLRPRVETGEAAPSQSEVSVVRPVL